MKRIYFVAVTALVFIGILASSCQPKKSVKLQSGIDSASYAIGILNGEGFRQNLASFPEQVSVDALLAGFEEALKEETSKYKMTPEDASTFINAYFTAAQEKLSKATKEESEKFLAENKTKPGIITTESGLQYQVITEGTGKKPAAEDKVKVHYTGSLLDADGTVFDSSIERGEPTIFGVSQVIQGWKEGLQIMPVGSKYVFWIPAELGYGEYPPRGSEIKPNSALKFEVELLEIVEE